MTAKVDEFAREAAARADEIESAGRLPRDLMERLLDAGVLRAALPATLGGASLAPSDWAALVIRAAAGDGSLGWVIAATISFNGVMAAAADSLFCEEFFGAQRAHLAGGVAGHGEAVPVAGGYQVHGCWDFCTGAWDATWLGGLCIERSEGRTPRLLFVMVPADRAEIKPHWDVVGLRGTASERVVMPRQTVPARWAMPVPAPADRCNQRGPIGSYGRGLWPTAVAVAATQLGVARRALDELANFAATKKRADTPGPLIDEQAFQRSYGENEGERPEFPGQGR